MYIALIPSFSLSHTQDWFPERNTLRLYEKWPLNLADQTSVESMLHILALITRITISLRIVFVSSVLSKQLSNLALRPSNDKK